MWKKKTHVKVLLIITRWSKKLKKLRLNYNFNFVWFTLTSYENIINENGIATLFFLHHILYL